MKLFSLPTRSDVGTATFCIVPSFIGKVPDESDRALRNIELSFAYVLLRGPIALFQLQLVDPIEPWHVVSNSSSCEVTMPLPSDLRVSRYCSLTIEALPSGSYRYWNRFDAAA